MAECEKLLTISVAAYNVETYLAETLDSFIQCETLPLMDIVVVNDGSRDATMEVARTYCDRFPDSIRCIDKENGGHGSTINASLAVAKGRYYRLLDGDDWCDPAGTDAFVRALTEAEADMVVSSYVEVRDGRETVQRPPEAPCDSMVHDLGSFLSWWYPMHAVTFRTQMLQEAQVHITENAFYVDRELVLKGIALSRTVLFVDAVVYRYRLGREGQSAEWRSWFKNIDGANRVAFAMVDFYRQACEEGLEEPYNGWLFNSIVGTLALRYKVMLYMGPSKENRARLEQFDRTLKAADPALHEATLNRNKRAGAALANAMRLYWPIAAFSRVDVAARMAIGH